AMPAWPLVTMQYTTRLPWPVQRATAAAAPNSMSSGCATTARAVDQSSSSGVSGGRASVEVMTPRYAAAHGASRRPGRVRCVVDRGGLDRGVLDRGHGRVH